MDRALPIVLCALIAASAACGSHAVRESGSRPSDVELPRQTNIVEGRVPRSATLETLLRQQEVDPTFTASLISAVAGVFNPRNLQADRTFRLTRSLDGLFREFQYQIDTNRFLRVVFRDRRPDGAPEFDVAVVPYPREVSIEGATAEITREHSSLSAAFDAAGESAQLPLVLADMFSGEIDFNSDLQRGDRASVLFERIKRNGEDAGYGDVQAAILAHDHKQLVGIRFTGADGKSGWYDEQGRSLKRPFLKSPLPFEPRVTSPFSTRRLHPLFGDYREHLGVDYAAPMGTAVVSVAAGTIEFADWSGESGRLVVVKHAGGYETMYLHLSAFGPGIHAGVHVEQGQLVGRVGMTGAATGPHLDFRVKKNGIHVNPLLEHSRMPPGEPISSDAMAAFVQVRDRALQSLQNLRPKATVAAAHEAPSGSTARASRVKS